LYLETNVRKYIRIRFLRIYDCLYERRKTNLPTLAEYVTSEIGKGDSKIPSHHKAIKNYTWNEYTGDYFYVALTLPDAMSRPQQTKNRMHISTCGTQRRYFAAQNTDNC